MKNSFAVLWMFIAANAFSQVPSAQIKIRETSGFLGMGGPRFIELQLSNEQRQLPLNSVNVNAGSYYFFGCKAAGDWLIDEDFINEELPKLAVGQGGQVYPAVWKADSISADSALLIGFHKQFLLHQPFKFQFTIDGNLVETELKVPMELWPGYDAFTDLSSRAGRAFVSQDYKNAISLYELILQNRAFDIFPAAAEARNKRTDAFGSYYAGGWSAVMTSFQDPQKDLKSKIADIDEFKPKVQFVLDSLPNPGLGISAAEPSVDSLVKKLSDIVIWITATRDSLQRALDDRNVRWILEGTASGRTGFQYLTVIEALGFGFSSANFADTTSHTLTCTISEEMQASLARNNLTESYETFVRLTNERYKQGLLLFPLEFLSNLQKDTAALRLPFLSMFKALNDYFSENYGSAQAEIFKIFRTCTDPEISSRFDQMRVMIGVRQGKYPPEALSLLDEAAALEGSNPDVAGEKYRQATILAPNFAYASFSLGKYYSRTGDPIRAQTFFERAYQTDTLYLSAYRESFNLYRRSANYKPMIEVLTRALRHGNNYWETHSNLGLAFMGDGDPARAIQYYERALVLNPKSYTTNIQLGLAYQTVKNFQKAREYFNNAINIDPLRQEAVEYLSRLNELQRGSK